MCIYISGLIPSALAYIHFLTTVHLCMFNPIEICATDHAHAPVSPNLVLIELPSASNRLSHAMQMPQSYPQNASSPRWTLNAARIISIWRIAKKFQLNAFKHQYRDTARSQPLPPVPSGSRVLQLLAYASSELVVNIYNTSSSLGKRAAANSQNLAEPLTAPRQAPNTKNKIIDNQLQFSSSLIKSRSSGKRDLEAKIKA